jgi:NADPH2:quinone reductase
VPGTGVVGIERGTGRRVAAHTGLSGGYADRVVVPAARVTVVPDGVTDQEAAALVHDATTALALFDVVGVGRDDVVLVVGASGGLGLVSLQLARARARQVVALARDARKVSRIRELGFAVVDTGEDGWLDQARALLPDGADVVLDNVGGPLGAASVPLVADGGRWSAHGTPGGSFTAIDPAEVARRGLSVRGIGDAQLDTARRMRLMGEGLEAAARGELAPVVGQAFPLERAAAAHRAIEERRVFGATLLVP